ncbi:ATP-binding protein [Sulfurovum sp.]|uniref:ATP-binding protein n=1 Tax=Sulfurovum sp. TaxID=1969726 RepID=UPI0025E971E5|nr:ATP-binding protein [Sulfurovum sp.]
MEKVILSQNKHWNKPYAELYERDIFPSLVKKLEVKHIQVLQGIRRSGKSTLFKLLINHLSLEIDPQEILYVNLDDPFFIPYSDDAAKLHDVIQTAQKLTQKNITYLFLDEVQAMNGWERYVKSVYDNEAFKKIFITGSNSSLLNGDLATLLTGRYLSTKVYPLSLKEILKINDITTYMQLVEHSPKVLNIVDNMVKYGSFVEIVDNKEEFRREILSAYYDTILLKDCVTNNAIRDVKSFKELSYYLLSNVTSLYSYNSLAKAIDINDKSAKEYVSYLENSYLIDEIKHYSYSLKEQNHSKKKIYANDNGFLSFSYSFSENRGKMLENLVYTELIKAGYEVYFYNKNFECDFIAIQDGKIIAIQVCYELHDQNRKREIGGLAKLPFEVDSKYIITYNQSDTSDSVKIVAFWEYFGV